MHFFDSQFNYYPTIWMLHNRFHSKINRLSERCLLTIYNDKQNSFDQFLNEENYVFIHHWNIQVLALELYKTVDGIAPEIIKEVFKLCEKNNYN